MVVTGGLLLLIFRKFDPGRVISAVEDARPFPLLLALAVSFFTNCWLAAVKWQKILSPLGLTLSFRESFLIKMGSGPLKSLLPFRTGEASRVIYLKRCHGFSVSRGTASILIELFLNILIFLLFIVGGGVVCPGAPPGVVTVVALILAGVMLTFLLAARSAPRRWVRRFLSRIPNPRLRGGLETFFTLHRFFSRRQIGVFLFYSLVIQGGKLITFFLIGSAFRIAFSPVVYLVILPFSILISTIPVTILGIGLREGSLIEMVPAYTGLSAGSVLGPALVFSLVEYLFPAVLGLFWTGKFTRTLFVGKGETDTKQDGISATDQ
ncbi:MAG: lysylphosphatidylglycerol synthase transmembrane domain-containing protein [PVC group bacterium]